MYQAPRAAKRHASTDLPPPHVRLTLTAMHPTLAYDQDCSISRSQCPTAHEYKYSPLSACEQAYSVVDDTLRVPVSTFAPSFTNVCMRTSREYLYSCAVGHCEREIEQSWSHASVGCRAVTGCPARIFCHRSGAWGLNDVLCVNICIRQGWRPRVSCRLRSSMRRSRICVSRA